VYTKDVDFNDKFKLSRLKNRHQRNMFHLYRLKFWYWWFFGSRSQRKKYTNVDSRSGGVG